MYKAVSECILGMIMPGPLHSKCLYHLCMIYRVKEEVEEGEKKKGEVLVYEYMKQMRLIGGGKILGRGEEEEPKNIKKK